MNVVYYTCLFLLLFTRKCSWKVVEGYYWVRLK